MTGAQALFVMHMIERHEREAREEERRQKERKRREEEEAQKLIEHRKYSPVCYSDESWQRARCYKAIQAQPCVKRLIDIIDITSYGVLTREKQILDDKINYCDSLYSAEKLEIDRLIHILRSKGIDIEGDQQKITRCVIDEHGSEYVTESFGLTFKPYGKEPIDLDPSILEDCDYYKKRYEATEPEKICEEFEKIDSAIIKYNKRAKIFRFLLKTEGYNELKNRLEELGELSEDSSAKKKEMDSFASLSETDLKLIKQYFTHLDNLAHFAKQANDFLDKKEHLSNVHNEKIYDTTIKEVLADDKNSALVSEVSDYITKIVSNDKETLAEAYKIVKGDYPIRISRKFLYVLLVKNICDLKIENPKQFIRN